MRLSVFALFLSFLILAGCNTVTVDRVPLAPPRPVPADAHPSPVIFKAIRNGVPLGTATVGVSVRNPRCPLVMRRTEKYFNPGNFPATAYREIFRDNLSGLGYDVAGDPNRFFDAEADEERAVYEVGARITDIKMDLCDERGILPTSVSAGIVGEAMVEIEWHVFDALRRRNVYKVRTRGYGRLDEPNDEGIPLLLEDAFAAATHNLGADPAFFEMAFHGVPPPKPPETFTDPADAVTSKFDNAAPVSLSAAPLLTKPAGARMAEYQRIAVLIQTAGGFGSGFFIDPEGDILTDAHVVGYAGQVRVVSADKKFSFVADVVARDAARDVALLRPENLPPALRPRLLPLRLERPRVGEDVYAVGAPLLTRLQGTVTKGIVSSVRYDSRRHLWFIQSDVFVYPGNSGGPLLDARGNILGLCISSYVGDGGDTLSGLNNFIPIEDALAALHIAVNGRAIAAAPMPVKEPISDDDNPSE